ncbi:MAG: class II aldolase/adducin family protein [Bacteroidales bacterium]|nr:class II aldolase/adducin family protein [Bacteroidales bacterium]MDD3665523.1 class II aldolase/adducin family protein [Bacteroidales bacterium]
MAPKTEKNKLKALRKTIVQSLKKIDSRGWSFLPWVRISIKVTGLPTLADYLTDQTLQAFPLPRAFPKLAGDSFLITSPGSSVDSIVKKPQENILLMKCAENGTLLQLLGSTRVSGFDVSDSLIQHLIFHETVADTMKHSAVVFAEPDNLLRLGSVLNYQNAFSPLQQLLAAWPPVTSLLDLSESNQLCQIYNEDPSGYRMAGFFPGVVLWERHGVYVAHKKLAAAITMLEAAEKAAGLCLSDVAAPAKILTD